MAATNIYLPFLEEESHYSGLYRKLISQSQNRDWSRKSAPCYVEEHHIWPKSIGGPDDSWNLVFLTAAEHFYAHYYLMKMLESQNDENYRKMIYACWQMNNRVTPGEDLERESKIYEETRNKISEKHSNYMKQFEGEYKSIYGKSWYYNPETKQQITRSPEDEIPEGFIKGKFISEETANKISKSNSGENHPYYNKKRPDEVREKVSKTRKGMIFTDEHRKNLSESKKNKPNYKNRESLKGRNLSDEHRKNISKSMKGMKSNTRGKKQPIVTCPYCNKEGSKGNMTRWHFDNCKHK